MADNDVRIKLSLDGDDKVRKGLSGVGDGASQADSKIGSLVKGGLKGAGAALVGFATASVAAGGALTAGVVKAYADYEQNIGGIETMFKGAAGTMKQYADDAYKTAGLSANDYMSQVTSFSAALIKGLGGDTAAAAEYANTAMVDMSDNANKFGSNIGDIQNAYQGFAKQNYTMLDNLKLGYGGTAAEMARLINDSGVMGDSFTATAQNMNEVSFDKIVAAIHTVQEDMGIAGTTAAEATETISGSIGMLKTSFDNLLTGLGGTDQDVAKLAGNVISSFETVVTNITPVIQNLGNNIATLGPQLGSMMSGLVGAISSAIPAILDAGVALIGGLVQGVSSSLPRLITAIVPGLVGLVEMVATQLPLLVDAGMKAVIALAQGLVQAIPQLIPAVVSMVAGLLDAIISNLPMLLQVGLDLIVALAQGILRSIPTLVSYLPRLITSIISFLLGAIPQLIQAGIQLLTALVGALPQIITAIVQAIPQIITGVVNAVITAVPQLIQAGITLFVALIKALPKIIVSIVKAVPRIITALVKAVTSSVPKLVQSGFKLLMGLITKLPSVVSKARSGILNLIGKLLSAIGSSIGRMASSGFRLLMGLAQRFPSAISSIVGKIPGFIGRMVSAVGNGISRMASVGGDLVRGIWNGISGAAGWLFDKIGGFASDVMSNIKGFFGIHSPSRRMAQEVGAWLPPGIGVGVEDNEDKAIKPIVKMSKRIMREASALPKLSVDHAVGIMAKSSPFTPKISPQQYAIPTPRVAASVTVDSQAITEALDKWVNNAAQNPTEVRIQNDIKMYDRDPRIVGKQLGRMVKGVLVG